MWIISPIFIAGFKVLGTVTSSNKYVVPFSPQTNPQNQITAENFCENKARHN